MIQQALDLPPASKNIDPSTSYAAEEKVTQSGKRQTNMQIIHAALKQYPLHTSAELAEQMKPGDFKWRMEVARRLPDLKHTGKAVQSGKRKCNITKNESVIWGIV